MVPAKSGNGHRYAFFPVGPTASEATITRGLLQASYKPLLTSCIFRAFDGLAKNGKNVTTVELIDNSLHKATSEVHR